MGPDDVTEQNFDQMRKAMVESQLRTTGVSDPRVIAAMAAVPRERYVPADRAPLSYADLATPLTATRALPAPMVLGRLLTEGRVSPADRALVVGAGSGYAAAVLAQLAAVVVALEEDAEIARGALPDNVESVSGPLAQGWVAGAPYDFILFDGAVEEVPAAIVDQLAEGGRLAAPIVQNGVVKLAIGRKSGAGFGMTTFIEASAPRLPGFAQPERFTF